MDYEGLNKVVPPIHAVCSSLFSLMINTMTNSNFGKERVYLAYISTPQSIIKGSQVRGLEAEN